MLVKKQCAASTKNNTTTSGKVASSSSTFDENTERWGEDVTAYAIIPTPTPPDGGDSGGEPPPAMDERWHTVRLKCNDGWIYLYLDVDICAVKDYNWVRHLAHTHVEDNLKVNCEFTAIGLSSDKTACSAVSGIMKNIRLAQTFNVVENGSILLPLITTD